MIKLKALDIHCEGCGGLIHEGEEILELTNSDGETVLLHQNAECAYQYVASDAYHTTARK